MFEPMLQPRLYFSFVAFELANYDTKRPVLRSSLKTFNRTRASGGFLVSCVELGLRGFSKLRAVKQLLSNSLKIGKKQGYLPAEDDVEIKDKGQQN